MKSTYLNEIGRELGYLQPNARLILELEIKNISPLHIGAERGADYRSPILRVCAFRGNEIVREPVIPESELKGILRSEVERLLVDDLDKLVRIFLSSLPNGTKFKQAFETVLDEISQRLVNKVSKDAVKDLLIKSLAYIVKFTHTPFGHVLVRRVLQEREDVLFRLKERPTVDVEAIKTLFYGFMSQQIEELLSRSDSGRENLLFNVGIRTLLLLVVHLYEGNIKERREEQRELIECLREACVRLCELLCPICRIFGGAVLADRLVLTAFRLADNSKVVTKHIVHASISRITGTVEPRRLFAVEVLEPGHEFRGELIIQMNLEDEGSLTILDAVPLLLLLQLLTGEYESTKERKDRGEEYLIIGGHKSTGHGVCKLTIRNAKLVKITPDMKIVTTDRDVQELKEKLCKIVEKYIR